MTEFQHQTERRRERAVVAALVAPGLDPEIELAEIKELLDTAGVDTAGEVVQRKDQPHVKAYLGSGKIDELKALVRHLEPDVVVVDDELTPSQQRNLSNLLECRVLDRTAVILDIFALHAHSAEGKLQVELAQLEYNMARMRGMWTHLERLGAGGGVGGPGVGTRGPGESQLETDRRLARHRITLLRRRLKDVKDHRATMRQRRQESVVPKVALAGYTNAGKSTLLNALTGSNVSSANRLFETLDPTTRSFEQAGRRYLVTDTVGFIERLPHGLIDAFSSTLEETLLADCIVLVADASMDEEKVRRQFDAVRDVLEEIGAGDIPQIVALNKVDRLDLESQRRVTNRWPEAVQISAKKSLNLGLLMERIAEAFAERWTEVDLLIPYADAGVLSTLYAAGAPVERRDDHDGIHAHAHVPHALLGRIGQYRVEPDRAADDSVSVV